MRRNLELEATIVEKYAAVETFLDERGRRIWAATESRAIGYGGDAVVSDATGLSRPTIRKGRREQESGGAEMGRICRAGAGRPSIEQSQPGVKQALEMLVVPVTRGDPQSPLRWTCKIPYGIYDIGRNEAWVSVGCDHDTPTFAVASLRRWWEEMGKGRYPEARELFITADAGGSNGYRSRARKYELQQFADDTGVRVHVSHFPPGTSKCNEIEHRLFCHITQNWRGKPLRTFETIVDPIGNTRTGAGLRVKAGLDTGEYPKGVTATDAEMDALSLHRNEFHGDWSDELRPR